MANRKLLDIRNSIEQFFYKIQLNIALHAAMESEEYITFRDDLEKAITKQIIYFAKIQKVNQVVGVSKAIDEDILKNIKRLWVPITDFVSRTKIKDYLTWVFEKSGQTVYNTVNTEQSFSPENHEAILAYIKNRSGDLAGIVDDTTISMIAKTITKGYESGESHYQIAKLVRAAATEVAEFRAELIAENEAALLIGELTIDVYKQNNIAYKKFVTSRDERVCPICIGDEEAGTIKVDEVFPSGVLAPPAHVVCRCFLLPMEKK